MYVRIFGAMSGAKIDAKSDNVQNFCFNISLLGGSPFADLLDVDGYQIEEVVMYTNM